MTMTYTKSATANEWSWTVSIPSGTGTATGSGTLTFDANGALQDGANPTISLALSNGAGTPQEITWTIYNDDGTTSGDMTQIASESCLSNQSQDGSAAGTLTSIATDEQGVITGTYSNGETKKLCQLALADFANNNGLNRTDSGLYEATALSGSAVMGVADSGQFGSISSGSLEMSTVDMAAEMSNMIIAQRAYEACAKMFTVESEIIQTTINAMK
jgi:flagellar hook protein FlgE